MVSGPLQLRLAARRKEITNRALHPNRLAVIKVFVVIEPEPVFIASAAQHFQVQTWPAIKLFATPPSRSDFSFC